MSRLARLLVVAVLFAQPALAQYSARIDVRIQNLDVVVNDRDGKAVKGLKAGDFIVLEDGVEQKISNFAFYDSGATVSPTFDAKIDDTIVDSESAPPPRRFMFFIDEMAIHTRARNSLKKHAADVVRSMRPGDVATIVRPTGAQRIIQDYSGDIAEVEKALHAAIDECRVRITSPAFAELRLFRRSMETASNSAEIANAKSQYAENERDRVQQRLAQIRALVATMAHQDGRKVFVLITSGISAQPGRAAYSFEEQMQLFEAPDPSADATALSRDIAAADAGGPGSAMASLRAEARGAAPRKMWDGMNRMKVGDFRSQIDALARSAATDGITIYALEPEIPLLLNASKGADSPNEGSTLFGGGVSGREVVPREMLSQLLTYTGETLTSLTEKTGGRWFRGPGAIDDTFRLLADDLRTYYSLAYRPRKESSSIRKIQVKVRNRDDLVVRTRTEVVDRRQGLGMAERVVAGLLYPQSEDTLQMQVRAAEPLKLGRMYEIPFELVIPVHRLTFAEASNGTFRAVVSVHYAVSRNDRELLSYGQHEQLVELTPQQHAQLGRGRYRYTGKVSVPKGTIKIAVGVVDTSTNYASLQTVSVEAR